MKKTSGNGNNNKDKKPSLQQKTKTNHSVDRKSESLKDKIESKIVAEKKAVKKAISKDINTVEHAIENVAERVRDDEQDLLNEAEIALNKTEKTVKDDAKKVFNKAEEIFEDVEEEVVDDSKKALNKAEQFFDEAEEIVEDDAKKALHKAEDFLHIDELEKDVKQAEEKISEHIHLGGCCNGHDHKLCFAGVVIVLISLCAIGEYFFDDSRYEKLSKSSENAVSSVRENSEKVKELSQKVDDVYNRLLNLEHQSTNLNIDKNDQRAKWKVWIALRNKLETGEDFKVELKAFREMFSYDNELIAIVDGVANEFGIEDVSVNDNAVMDTVRKYVDKVVKIRKINYSKLSEISGYVITSINKEQSK